MKPLHVSTAVIELPGWSAELGRPVFAKMECQQPAGSFKLRGMGLKASKALRERGGDAASLHLVCASGGNAGYAVAWSGARLGCRVTIVVPHTTAPAVQDRIAALGARVMCEGRDWDEAHAVALSVCAQHQAVYVHPFDDPDVWEGHASMMDEVARQMPQASAVILSVGGGGLLCGVLAGMHRQGWEQVPVYAVETAGAASLAAAMAADALVELPAIESLATTLGARRVAAEALAWTHRHAVTALQVSDRQAVAAVRRFADEARCLVEPACGAALAALPEVARRTSGTGPVLVIACGGMGVSLDALQAWETAVAA